MQAENGRTDPISVGSRIYRGPIIISSPIATPTQVLSASPTVKIKFKVEPGIERYPEDRWYAWLKDEWVLVLPEKIVPDYAPDGQAYLFLLADTISMLRAAERRAMTMRGTALLLAALALSRRRSCGRRLAGRTCFVRPKGGL